MQPSVPLSNGELIDVEGRRIFADKSGSGAPTIVFLPGAGLVGLDFLIIRDRAAALSTSLIYDRGGTGWSDETPLPRSAEAVARELRAVLQHAGAPKPFLLVGHSLGAFYARRYAQLFPDEVAGLLLLDPGHEDIFDFMPPGAAEMSLRMKQDVAALPDLTEAQIAGARAQFAKIYADWPPTVREALIEHHLTHWRTGLAEAANMEDEIYREMRQGGPLPDVPLDAAHRQGPQSVLGQVHVGGADADRAGRGPRPACLDDRLGDARRASRARGRLRTSTCTWNSRTRSSQPSPT